MIAVIFEVTIKEGQQERYFGLAADLRAELEQIDGFISVERFQSLAEAGKFVSISLWRDEAAVMAWREHAGHGAAQALGKDALFADYRITVAESLRSYRLADSTSDRFGGA
jgi:heme-degrading monooxygenase HmoA